MSFVMGFAQVALQGAALTGFSSAGSRGFINTFSRGVFDFQTRNRIYGSRRLGCRRFSTVTTKSLRDFNIAVAKLGKRQKRRFGETEFDVGETFDRAGAKRRKKSDENCYGDILKVQKPLLLERVAYHIQMRRITLFFLQCLYWQEGCTIELETTTHQNGTANCGCCAACHFCVTPNVRDNFIPRLIGMVQSQGITAEVERQCELLRIKAGKMAPADLVKALEAKQAVQYRLFDNKSVMFMLMNGCVQLYSDFNENDCVYERWMRSVAVWLLNGAAGSHIDASQRVKPFGQLQLPSLDKPATPQEGSEHYETWERGFYARNLTSIEKKEKLMQVYYTAEAALYSEERGSFDVDRYLAAIEKVRVAKAAVEEGGRFGYAPAIRLKDRLEERMPILEAIETLLKEEKARLDGGDAPKMVEQWQKWLGNAPPDLKSKANLLAPKLAKNPSLAMNEILRTYPAPALIEMFGHRQKMEQVIRNSLKTLWILSPKEEGDRVMQVARKVRSLYLAETKPAKADEAISVLKKRTVIPVDIAAGKITGKVDTEMQKLKLFLTQDYEKARQRAGK